MRDMIGNKTFAIRSYGNKNTYLIALRKCIIGKGVSSVVVESDERIIFSALNTYGVY